MSAPQLPRAAKVTKAKRPIRLAILYSRPPIPMTRADQKTVAHLIEFLSARGHEVDLYTLAGEEPFTDAARQWLETRCQKVSVIHTSKLSSLLRSAAAALRGRPLQVGYFWSSEQARALAQGLSSRNYDLVYVYYIRSAPVYERAMSLAAIERSSVVSFLGMQLSQALNTRRMVEKMTRWRDLAIYGIESRNLRSFESAVWKLFDRVVLIGPKDLEELRQLCRETGQPEADNVFLCAHGVDIEEFKPDWGRSEEDKTLVFSGVMRTNTNVHAITWFAREVWPRIKQAEPSARLYVVGRQPAPEVVKLGELAGLTITGEVASPADYIRKATVCINPIQVGAGMQNKLLEFLAMGKATVATTLANEGIGAIPGRDLVIADTAEEFAEATLKLLRDPGQRLALGRSAREYVEKQWSWEAQFTLLEEEFYRALGER